MMEAGQHAVQSVHAWRVSFLSERHVFPAMSAYTGLLVSCEARLKNILQSVSTWSVSVNPPTDALGESRYVKLVETGYGILNRMSNRLSGRGLWVAGLQGRRRGEEGWDSEDSDAAQGAGAHRRSSDDKCAPPLFSPPFSPPFTPSFPEGTTRPPNMWDCLHHYCARAQCRYYHANRTGPGGSRPRGAVLMWHSSIAWRALAELWTWWDARRGHCSGPARRRGTRGSASCRRPPPLSVGAALWCRMRHQTAGSHLLRRPAPHQTERGLFPDLRRCRP